MKAWANMRMAVMLWGCFLGVFAALFSANASASDEVMFSVDEVLSPDEGIIFSCHDESGSEYGERDVASQLYGLKSDEKSVGRAFYYEKEPDPWRIIRRSHSLIWGKIFYYHQTGNLEELYLLDEQLQGIIEDAEYSDSNGYTRKKTAFELYREKQSGEEIKEKYSEKFSIGAFVKLLGLGKLAIADLTEDVKAQAEAVEIVQRDDRKKQLNRARSGPPLGDYYSLAPIGPREEAGFLRAKARLAEMKGSSKDLSELVEEIKRRKVRYIQYEAKKAKHATERPQHETLKWDHQFALFYLRHFDLVEARALVSLGTLNKTSSLIEEALQLYEAALRDIDETCTPVLKGRFLKAKAGGQLALAGHLVGEDRVKLLRRAEQTLEQAETFLPLTKYPLYWSRLMKIRARVYEELAAVPMEKLDGVWINKDRYAILARQTKQLLQRVRRQ